MNSLFRGHRLSCFTSCLFFFYTKTYLALLKAASIHPHIIGADGGFMRTRNTLLIPGAHLTREPALTLPSLQMKTDGLILPYCISLYGVSGSSPTPPPPQPQPQTGPAPLHNGLFSSLPLTKRAYLAAAPIEIIQRGPDKRGRQRGLRVKVAEKLILRLGELKRARDRHEERESGFLRGGTCSVFHISTLMGILH